MIATRLTVFAICIAVCCANASGEQIVFPKGGDARVDGSFIQPYRVKWKLTGKGKDGTTKDGGTWSDTVSFIEKDGKELIARKQIWNYGTGTETHISLVDHKTLLPRLTEFTSTVGIYYRVEYSADGQTARYQRSPAPDANAKSYSVSSPMEQGTLKLDFPMWDYDGGMWGLLLAAFPLSDGYSAKIPVFHLVDPEKHPAWVDFKVEGKDNVPIGGGTPIEAWHVTANSPQSGETIRFSLSKVSPYVVGLQQEWQGLDWTFEKID